jgi:tripartite-type tricarboxylate transporter receptor subunit TctC
MHLQKIFQATVVALCSSLALAQNYPSRPIRVIVPLPPAGAMDNIVRAVTQRLALGMAQNFIIDNRPGAGGNVSLEIAAAAAPDGYTLVAIAPSSIVYPMIFKSRIDILRDLEPLSQISAQGYIVVVHPAMPARSAQELVKVLKANPGKYNFASSGVAGPIHLTAELFMAATETKMVHVPYKGTALAYTDMIAGSIQVGFPTIYSALPHIRANRLRGLAVTTPAVSPAIPELPTLADAGVRGVEVVSWYALAAPAAIPKAIVERLSNEIGSAVRHSELANRLHAEGSEAVASSPAELRKVIVSDREKWTRVIKAAGIRLE